MKTHKLLVTLLGGTYTEHLEADNYFDAKTLALAHVGDDALQRAEKDFIAVFWHPDSTDSAKISEISTIAEGGAK